MKKIYFIALIPFLMLHSTSIQIDHENETLNPETKIIKLSVHSNMLSVFCKSDNYYLNIKGNYSTKKKNYIRFMFDKKVVDFSNINYEGNYFVLSKSDFGQLANYLTKTDIFNFTVNGSDFTEIKIQILPTQSSINHFLHECHL